MSSSTTNGCFNHTCDTEWSYAHAVRVLDTCHRLLSISSDDISTGGLHNAHSWESAASNTALWVLCGFLRPQL